MKEKSKIKISLKTIKKNTICIIDFYLCSSKNVRRQQQKTKASQNEKLKTERVVKTKRKIHKFTS
jgi:hypothetical protein